MQFDDRITRKVPGAGTHVMLTCRNHLHLRWTTKNISPIGCRNIFFAGQNERGDGTKEYNEFIVPRRTALKMLAAGELVNRKTGDGSIMENTPENVAWVNARYDGLEQKYVFECDCPGSDLIIDPMYDSMPDVEM